jgi:hemin uptake protein HemP
MPKKPFAGPPTPEFDSSRAPMNGSVRYRVDELLKGGREATLIHRGQEYRLRITSTGKLILTK